MQDAATRLLIGDSLGFHIFFVMIGIGLPLLITIFEFLALKRGDKQLLEQVRKWTTAAAVFVVAGLMSGTLIAVQLALLWPQFMAFVSKVIGPAFMFEGYFFLIEAAFLSWYVLSWGRIKGFKHWLIGFGTIVGTIGSAVVITLVNAWMNQPVGFKLVDGQPVDVSIPTALFTSTGYVTVFHSILSYLTTVTLVLAGLYAIGYVRKSAAKKELFRYLSIRLALIGLVFGGLTAVFGDMTAKNLMVQNPQKLAAYELQLKTEGSAPYRIGGTYNESTNTVDGAIEIPYVFSFLGTGSPTGTVQGLDKTPKNEWPPLVTHLLFDIKMGTAILALAIPLALLLVNLRSLKDKFKKLRAFLWRLLPIAGISAFVTVELGWIMAELGRQPYIIKGIMLTKDSYSEDPSVITFGYMFPVAFVLLLIATFVALPIALKHFNVKEAK
jgi:cytochrome d ubiquinol oxidase subunit I